MAAIDPHARDSFEWAGASPAVLLIHGFTSTPWELRPIANALRELGFACKAPLLPGHGTTPQALSKTVWNDWAEAVDEEIISLRNSHEKVIIVGASLGGLLALDAAARHQNDAVRGVVTLAAAMRLSPFSTLTLDLANLAGRHLPNVFAPKIGGSDVRDPDARAQNPSYSSYPLRAAREFAVGQRAARAALPHLTLPVLAIHGLLDQTTPLASSLEIVRTVASRDVSMIVMPHSGHVLGVDFDHDQVARQVCAFVQRNAQELVGRGNAA